jgi:2-amino-4-hydroxy-6-hydroxymethyldihydropteridine diphosphokinase
VSPDVLLGLGANRGDREGQLEAALRHLARHGINAASRSALYLTEPVLTPGPEWFVNAAVTCATALGPEDVLEACLAVERELGRVRDERNGPRTIDLDVLLYAEEVRKDGALTLPHPRLHERRFVLVPAVEVAPDWRHPLLGRTLADLLAACPDRSEVRRHRPAEAWT